MKTMFFWAWLMAAFMPPSFASEEASRRGYFGFASRAEAAPQGSGRALRLVEILDRGPADQAGLEVGDRIVAINQQPVTFLTDLEASRGLAQFRSGNELNLTVLRNGQQLEVKMTLATIPAETLKRIQAWERRAEQACAGSPAQRPAESEPAAVPVAGEIVHDPDGAIETLLTAEGTAVLDLISDHPDRRARIELRRSNAEPEASLELAGQRPLTVAISSLPPTIQAAAAKLTEESQAAFLIEFPDPNSKRFRVHQQRPKADEP